MIDTISSAATLAERLRERILHGGPITFCDWMQAALYDEREGYYNRANSRPWGREGDYRTNPERSSLFASTFARYFATLYDKLGQPAKWTIVEAGAGDGSFAIGVLNALKEFFPHILSATRYVVDEIGSADRDLIATRLEAFRERVEFTDLGSIEPGPEIVFSNELLDAFPVHRVTKRKGQLLEFYVGVGGDGKFVWLLDSPSAQRLANYFDEYEIRLVEGQVAEVNLAMEDWLKLASSKISRGCLITVDYGLDAPELYSPTERMNGTLRSFKRHRLIDDLLSEPGEQDLTSTVNWSSVRAVAERHGLKTIAFQRQDKFLLSAGLLIQLELESERASDDAERLRLSTAAREMILPNGMAASFQVLVQGKETGQ